MAASSTGSIMLESSSPRVGHKNSPLAFPISEASRLMSPRRIARQLNGGIPRRVFDRRLNLEFHGSRIELEGVNMDFKKLIADLVARYRKRTEPISSSSLAPPGEVVDVVTEMARLSAAELREQIFNEGEWFQARQLRSSPRV